MREFLEALYGDLPEGAIWYLWTLPGGSNNGSTHWFTDCARAEALALASTDCNVYYPIGWTMEKAPGRPSEAQTAGIVAFVADVDLRDAGKHKLAPANEADALDLIAQFPLRPTACVHSGHGLQCLWLFKEPWVFESAEERGRAKHLSKCWAYTLSGIASKRGQGLDSVFDLARIMRLPHTVNVKNPANPVPVCVLWMDGNRCNWQDIVDLCTEYVPDQAPLEVPAIDLSSDFPLEKHEALCEVHEGYKATWGHTRKDLNDNSASGYDYALACILAGLNWPDNEVAAVLRENQRRWGDKPEKVNDTRYFALTISKARAFRKQAAARETAVDVLSEPDADRDEMIQALATRLEIPVTNIQLVSGDPAMMRFWIAGKCAEVPATALDTPRAFFQVMISTAQHYPRPIGQKEKPGWRDYVNIMLRVAEPVEAGEDATLDGEFRGAVRGFLDSRGVIQAPEGELLKSMNTPFVRSERVWIRIDDLAAYMKVFNQRIERRTLVQRLKTMGAENRPHGVNGRPSGKVKSVRFYGIPEAVFEGEL